MIDKLIIESSSDKTTVQDKLNGNQDVRYLTLRNPNKESNVRYYVSLTGKDADIEWQEGDHILVELSFCAYKAQGQWHLSNHWDSIKFIEIGNINVSTTNFYDK